MRDIFKYELSHKSELSNRNLNLLLLRGRKRSKTVPAEFYDDSPLIYLVLRSAM